MGAVLRLHLWWKVLHAEWPVLHRRVLEHTAKVLDEASLPEGSQADLERRQALAVIRWVRACTPWPPEMPPIPEAEAVAAAEEIRRIRGTRRVAGSLDRLWGAGGSVRLVPGAPRGKGWSEAARVKVRAAATGREASAWTRRRVARVAALGVGAAHALGDARWA